MGCDHYYREGEGDSDSSSDEEGLEQEGDEGQQQMDTGGGGGGSDSDSSSFDEDADSSDGLSSDDDENGKEEQDKDEELDGDDAVIRAIEKAKEKKVSNRPKDLILPGMPNSLSFHPTEDQILFGNYDGELLLYGYSLEENCKLASSKHTNESAVRGLSFSSDGSKVIAAFSDQTLKLYDVADGLKLERTETGATAAPLSAIYVIDENTFSTGDDDGNVIIWDKRSSKPASSLRLGEDAITSFVSNDQRRILVATSEEGAIYAVKIRAGKVLVESEIYDYEFNCSCVFKQESKLAVGDGNGDVYIFNWDEFGKHSDISTGIGRGEALQAMIPITERILLCGGDDGYIRAFHFFPQKYLGVVGRVSYPVEKMDVCNDGHLIASIGPDETVKFWNVSYFENMSIPTGPDAASAAKKKEDGKVKEKPAKEIKPKSKGAGERQDSNKHLPSSSHQNASDFFKGLAD